MKRKQTYKLSYKTKTLRNDNKKLQYDEMTRKTDHVTLNTHDS